MKRRRWLGAMRAAAILALIGLLALSGCQPAGQTGPVKVRIGEVTRSIFYAPQYAAISKGYFFEQGLDPELITTFGGDKTMTTLLSGGIDIALVGSETSIYVYQQGSADPVINFAQLTETDGTFLVARHPPEGPFDWGQLKGSTFLGQRKGGMPQMAGEFVLRERGIDPHKDLKLVQNVDFANIPSAFASGTGEYVQLFEPQASLFEKQGKGYVVASFGAAGGRLPYTVYMAKRSFIAKKSDTVQKFANAVQKAQLWIQSAPVEDIANAIAPYFQDIPIDVIRSVVKRYKEQGTYAGDGIIDGQEWEHLQDVMQAAGELERRVDRGTLVDTRFADKAKLHVRLDR